MKPSRWTWAMAALVMGVAPSCGQDEPEGPGPGISAEARASIRALPSQEEQAALARECRVPLPRVLAARDALQAHDPPGARQALGEAERALRLVYQQAPGAELLRRFRELRLELAELLPAERRRPVDFAPLWSSLDELSPYLRPSVLEQARDAEKRYAGGDQARADESLGKAMKEAEQDLALRPLEESYARIRAAQAALESGDEALALRFLDAVPLELARVERTAPLQPIRFHLMAAARAADERNWNRASTLLDDAANRLVELRVEVQGTAMANRLQPLVETALDLQHELDKGRKPSARELRALAEATHEVDPD